MRAGALVWVGLVVRFVCVIRHPCARVCARRPTPACVSPVFPGSPGVLPEHRITNRGKPSIPLMPSPVVGGQERPRMVLMAVVFHSQWFKSQVKSIQKQQTTIRQPMT